MICPSCNASNLPGSEVCRHCLHDLTQLDKPVAHDRVEKSLMEDPVRVLNPRKAVTLPPTATVAQAIQTMLACDIGAVLVVTPEGQLAGIFSERDLLTKVTNGNCSAASLPIAHFMTPHPETVRESDSLAFVLHKMDVGGYRHLPVLQEGGKPLGMISVRDMLRHITRLCKNCGC